MVPWDIGGAVCLCGGTVRHGNAVDRLRQNIKQTMHDLRYGRDTLPQGELSQANLLHESSKNMLNVHTEQ